MTDNQIIIADAYLGLRRWFWGGFANADDFHCAMEQAIAEQLGWTPTTARWWEAVK